MKENRATCYFILSIYVSHKNFISVPMHCLKFFQALIVNVKTIQFVKIHRETFFFIESNKLAWPQPVKLLLVVINDYKKILKFLLKLQN